MPNTVSPWSHCKKNQRTTLHNSMVVLDRKGAEKLTGKGDALLKLPEEVNLIRFQAPMIETADIAPVVKYWSR